MSELDTRWKQRLSNFCKALTSLERSVAVIENFFLEQQAEEAESGLLELVKQGLIQNFEYTHELAWNVMKDYLAYQGNETIRGSRDATREAFAIHLLNDGEIWMDMIKSRNQTSHTYNEGTAQEIFDRILNDYFPAFLSFRDEMEGLQNGNSNE